MEIGTAVNAIQEEGYTKGFVLLYDSRSTSVSYTHLDVYKRQCLIHLRKNTLPLLTTETIAVVYLMTLSMIS